MAAMTTTTKTTAIIKNVVFTKHLLITRETAISDTAHIFPALVFTYCDEPFQVTTLFLNGINIFSLVFSVSIMMESLNNVARGL